jgi:lipoprotein-anchoring transpeptidase ErfK/SrfK
VTRPVPATTQDVSAAVAEANRLLATTVTLRAYDPIDDRKATLIVNPPTWGRWLSLTPDVSAPNGFRWTVDGRAAEDYLVNWTQQQFGDGRYLEQEAALSALSAAIQTQQPEVSVRVYHQPSRHVVAAGETLSSIGRAYGIPYPWIEQANPGAGTLTEGQTILIPSPDAMIPLPPVEGKRVEVSISEQRARVYENGQIKWDWPASTGIESSPTAPGVFQIQSHEPNAYAGNWDLWMPAFMGIYRPVPTSDFMNGFHGFPTRGNAQLLWTGDLGHPVTYGCILLSSENAQTLYDWAEAGVIVKVLP